MSFEEKMKCFVKGFDLRKDIERLSDFADFASKASTKARINIDPNIFKQSLDDMGRRIKEDKCIPESRVGSASEFLGRAYGHADQKFWDFVVKDLEGLIDTLEAPL